MNEYETALLRFERISRGHAEIKRQAQAIIDWTDDEWDAAQANLRQYEKSPGIELPQYRRDLTVPMAPVTPWTLADAAHEAERIARDT
jgi:hypothetical protein